MKLSFAATQAPPLALVTATQLIIIMADKMEGVETTTSETPKGQTSKQLTSGTSIQGLVTLHRSDCQTAITANYTLLEQAISQFDARFSLRVLRSISSTRKSPHFAEALLNAINDLYASHPDAPSKHFLTAALGKSKGALNGSASHKPTAGEPLAEAFVYLAILVQVGGSRKPAQNGYLQC